MDHKQGETESSSSFASQTDCMMDAVRYVVERRRDHTGGDGIEETSNALSRTRNAQRVLRDSQADPHP